MDAAYFAPPIFLIIAFTFSMLGMGGGLLYIPILSWFGLDFSTQAIPLGLLLNGITTLSATTTYARARLIDWSTAIPFGIGMVLFPPLGTWLNVKLPTTPIIIIFATLILLAAVLMISGWKPKCGSWVGLKRVLLGLTAGGALGFIAGLTGLGGGVFVVPLLYLAGIDPKVAAGTSALVVAASSTSAFLSHLTTTATPDWTLWLVCLVVVLIGSQMGSHIMAIKLDPKTIRTGFGVVLVIVAVILIVRNVVFPLT